jgi:hypothetical protein
MSTNFVNKSTGELVTLANGTRMWIGTKSAHDLAVQQGTMPNNCMVCITDDYYDDSANIYMKSPMGSSGVATLEIPTTYTDEQLRGIYQVICCPPAQDSNKTVLGYALLWIIDNIASTSIKQLGDWMKISSNTNTYTLASPEHRKVTCTMDSSSYQPVLQLRKIGVIG